MALFHLEELKTTEKETDKKYGLLYQDQIILNCDEEDKEAIEQLAHQLNIIYANHEIGIRAGTKLVEYYQELILKTLTDKLDNIDNMYAMKKMLTETANELEKLVTRITAMNEAGKFDKKTEKEEIALKE